MPLTKKEVCRLLRQKRKEKLQEKRKQGIIGCSHASPNNCDKCIRKLEAYWEAGLLRRWGSGSFMASTYALMLFEKKKKH